MLMDLASAYTEEIEEGIARVRTSTNPPKETENEIKSILQTVSLLENELRTQKSSAKREELQMKVSGYKRELDALLEDCKKKALFSSNKKSGGGRVHPDDDAKLLDDDDEEEDDEEKANYAALHNSRRAIKDSLKNVGEIQQVGAGILSNLDDQSRTIDSALDKVKKTDALAGKARGTIRSIENRDFKQKMVMYGAVVGVIILVVIAIYVMVT